MKPRKDEQVFLDKFYLLVCTRKNDNFLGKKPGLKASRTSFSTRKVARVYVQQGTFEKGIYVYVLNSCGLVKVVKKNIVEFRVHKNK